jgi:hypothetical protein
MTAERFLNAVLSGMVNQETGQTAKHFVAYAALVGEPFGYADRVFTLRVEHGRSVFAVSATKFL